MEIYLASEEIEDGRQATVDDLIEINLGTPEDPRLILFLMKKKNINIKHYWKNTRIVLLGLTMRCLAWHQRWRSIN